MEQRQIYKIVKPQFDSDVYTKIKNIGEINEEFDLFRVVSYEVENKKIMLFVDLLKGWVFSYNGVDEVTLIVLNNYEMLKYLTTLKEKFKEVYSDIDNRIKELKVLIESKKPNKIKELIKGDKTLKIGTILYTSWGYDQTNIEMFKIVKFLGKNYFIIQEITQEKVKGSDGFMCCSVNAGNEKLNTLPIKAFISNDGYMSICERGYKRGLFIDEGEKHYKSWYA